MINKTLLYILVNNVLWGLFRQPETAKEFYLVIRPARTVIRVLLQYPRYIKIMIIRLTCVKKLRIRLENFKGVFALMPSDRLYFASLEIDKSYSLTLTQWKNSCHGWSHDQPRPGTRGGRQERPWERGCHIAKPHFKKEHILYFWNVKFA